MFNRKTEMQTITYRQFRQILNASSVGQVKHKPEQTIILDSKGRLLAKMQAATVDKNGQCQPVRYFAVSKRSHFKSIEPPKFLAA